MAAGLACGQAGEVPRPQIARLPTLTPTAAVETAESPPPPPGVQPAAATDGSVAVALPPATDGWRFAALHTELTENGDLQLTGELINESGQPQLVGAISGTFYNDQGELLAGPAGTEAAWPVELAQPGGWLPFKIIVPGLQTAANYDLSVSAQPTDKMLRQDFQFTAQETSVQAGQYCLTGQLQNPGDALQDHLVIGLVLYNNQDNLINYSSYNELYFADVTGEQLLDFEICVPPPHQNVARYELRAWGR